MNWEPNEVWAMPQTQVPSTRFKDNHFFLNGWFVSPFYIFSPCYTFETARHVAPVSWHNLIVSLCAALSAFSLKTCCFAVEGAYCVGAAMPAKWNAYLFFLQGVYPFTGNVADWGGSALLQDACFTIGFDDAICTLFAERSLFFSNSVYRLPASVRLSGGKTVRQMNRTPKVRHETFVVQFGYFQVCVRLESRNAQKRVREIRA